MKKILLLTIASITLSLGLMGQNEVQEAPSQTAERVSAEKKVVTAKMNTKVITKREAEIRQKGKKSKCGSKGKKACCSSKKAKTDSDGQANAEAAEGEVMTETAKKSCCSKKEKKSCCSGKKAKTGNTANAELDTEGSDEIAKAHNKGCCSGMKKKCSGKKGKALKAKEVKQ